MAFGHHEYLPPAGGSKASSDRAFGLVLSGVVTAVALWPVLHGRPIRVWAVGLALLLLAAAWLRPSLLGRPNRGAQALARAANAVLWAVTYFALLTPIAIVARRVRPDPLSLRLEPGRTSYWTDRSGPNPADMRRQF